MPKHINQTQSPQREPVECLICAEQCEAVLIFGCGHFTCYACGLRIHALTKEGCPVCRKGEKIAVVTQAAPSGLNNQFSEADVKSLGDLAIVDKFLHCRIDGRQLAREMAKLYEFLCPMPECWSQGQQDPFVARSILLDHLAVDHGMEYCLICLESRPVFLCEQILYSSEALKLHWEGLCPSDSTSFTGHPPCRFCSGKRFYDAEALLKHMTHSHYTCDVCNRSQFTFTFYANRSKLLAHFTRSHKMCDHPHCAPLDPLLRVFASDIDLAIHKQRVHGVKAKLVFSTGSLGVTSAEEGLLGPTSGSNGPATASHTNVIQITFDHVSRKETVEMHPNRAKSGGKGYRRKGGGGDGGSAYRHNVYAPQANGVPPHYRQKGVLFALMRNVGSEETNASPSSESARKDSKSSFPHAFGLAEDMETLQNNAWIPTDPAEQSKLLQELIDSEVRSPVAYARLRGYTKDYISSKMFASEFYNKLACECFTDASVFNKVFPLLLATIPVPEKKDALGELWKMRMAPEVQRAERVRNEDVKATEMKRLEDSMWQKLSTNAALQKGKSESAKKKNAWLDTGAKAKVAQNAGGTDTKSNNYIQNTSNSTGRGGIAMQKPGSENSASVWGAATTPIASSPTVSPLPSFPTLQSALQNDSNFPQLPQTNIRRAVGGKKGVGRPNAWFTR